MIAGSTLISLLITLVVAGLIFWLVMWFVGFVGLPQPFLMIVKVVMGLVVLIFLLNLLMGLGGHPLVAWR